LFSVDSDLKSIHCLNSPAQSETHSIKSETYGTQAKDSLFNSNCVSQSNTGTISIIAKVIIDINRIYKKVSIRFLDIKNLNIFLQL